MTGGTERRLLGRRDPLVARDELGRTRGERRGEIVELLEDEVPARRRRARQRDHDVGRVRQQIEEEAAVHEIKLPRRLPASDVGLDHFDPRDVA